MQMNLTHHFMACRCMAKYWAFERCPRHAMCDGEPFQFARSIGGIEASRFSIPY
jgi:hypothetical protein